MGLLIVCLSSEAEAQSIEMLGFYGAAYEEVVVGGDYAYCLGEGILTVLDVSEPGGPVHVGHALLPDSSLYGPALTGAVSGGLLCIVHHNSTDGSSLLLVDVVNPALPKLLERYKPEAAGSISDVAIEDGIAYIGGIVVIDGIFGGFIEVVDLTTPVTPSLIGTYPVGIARVGIASEIEVEDGIVYYTNQNTVSAVDLSNPAAPVALGSFTPVRGSGAGMRVQDKLVYVVGYDWEFYNLSHGRLEIIDYTDPFSPTLAGAVDWNFEEDLSDLALDGETAYVAGDLSLARFDISDPASAVLLDETAYLNQPYTSLTIANNAAFVANGGLLRVYDIEDAPRPLYSLRSFNPDAVEVVDNAAFVADNTTGFHVLDVGDPTAPALLSTGRLSLEEDDTVEGLAVANDMVYLVWRDHHSDYEGHLEIFGVANLTRPVSWGSYETQIRPTGVVVKDDIVCITGSESLEIVDVRSPGSPAFLALFPTPGSIGDMVFIDAVAAIADATAGLLLVDLSDPASPELLSTFPTKKPARSVAVSGNKVFVGENYGSFLSGYSGAVEVIDIANPRAPVLVDSLESGDDPMIHGDHVAVQGDFLYADVTKGLGVWRLSGNSSPEFLSSFDIAAKDIFVDDKIYVTTEHALAVLQYGSGGGGSDDEGEGEGGANGEGEGDGAGGGTSAGCFADGMGGPTGYQGDILVLVLAVLVVELLRRKRLWRKAEQQRLLRRSSSQ